MQFARYSALAYGLTFATAFSATVGTAVFGPPHIHVTPVPGTPAMNAPALTVELEHHHTAVAVTGRAITQRNGARVEQKLTLSKVDSAHYTVPRTWDASTPWVVVLGVEQGPDGAYGVVEAIVSIDKGGAVKNIEYTTPDFISKNTPKRVTREKTDEVLARLMKP